MRLSLALGCPVSTLLRYADENELELWEAWEYVYGLLGPQRDDYQAASIVQATLAPHGGKLTIADARVFGERDLRTPREIHEEQLQKQRVQADCMVRVAKAEARIAELSKQGRMDDFGKELDENGNWRGPITDRPAASTL